MNKQTFPADCEKETTTDDDKKKKLQSKIH